MNFKIHCVHYGWWGLSSNVYLVENLKDKSKSIIVDTSTKSSVRSTLEGIKKVRVDYNDISLIVLTHSHIDHSGGLVDLKKHLKNAQVLIHQSEWNDLARGDFQMPKGNWFFTNTVSWLGSIIKDKTGLLKYDKYEAEITMYKKYKLDHFGKNCFIVHTPGHSKGSVSVVLDNRAIVGDTMYNRFNGWVGNFPAFINDKNKVLEQWKILLDFGCDTFYPGHGTVLKAETIKKTYF